MKIGDILLASGGAMYRLEQLTEDDECILKPVKTGENLPPIPRTVAENRFTKVVFAATVNQLDDRTVAA